MKDEKGLYYYPFPQNRRVRMYVKQSGNDISFRLWSADDEQLWEEHGWVSHEAILQAAKLYKEEKRTGGFDPRQAYDIHAARALIREEGDIVSS